MSQQDFAELARRAREQVVTTTPPKHAFETFPNRRSRGLVLGAVAAVLCVAASMTALGSDNVPGSGSGPDATSAMTPCSAMQVLGAESRERELVVTLDNAGTTACDLRGLTATVAMPYQGPVLSHTAEAHAYGGWRAILQPADEAILRIATVPSCQFAGAQLTLEFADATSVGLVDPQESAPCEEPAPGFGIAVVQPGPDTLVEVPDLVGMPSLDARRLLRGTYLEGVHLPDGPTYADVMADVTAQEPEPGSMVKPGSKVTLIVPTLIPSLIIDTGGRKDLHLVEADTGRDLHIRIGVRTVHFGEAFCKLPLAAVDGQGRRVST